MLQSLNHLGSPTLHSGMLMFACLGQPMSGHSPSGMSQQCWVEKNDLDLDLLATYFPNAAQDAFGFLCCKGSLLAYGVTWNPWEPPRCFSAKPLSSWSSLILFWCLGLFLPRCRTLYFPLLDFIKFLLAYGWAFQGLSESNQLVCELLFPVGVVRKLAESTPYPIMQVINELVKWNWP